MQIIKLVKFLKFFKVLLIPSNYLIFINHRSFVTKRQHNSYFTAILTLIQPLTVNEKKLLHFSI